MELRLGMSWCLTEDLKLVVEVRADGWTLTTVWTSQRVVHSNQLLSERRHATSVGLHCLAEVIRVTQLVDQWLLTST